MEHVNGFMGQIIGPFSANEDLYEKIKENCILDFKYIKHIGIQTDSGNIISINNQDYEIGTTGIYEIRNTKITSLHFLKDVDENTIIDYTIQI